MQTPNYKKFKKNGTTMYVFPSVEDDKNFETQNDNYRMYLSHYALVKFPRQLINDNTLPMGQSSVGDKLNFDGTFHQNGSSIKPVAFKDQLVESLRNYVANQEATIKNSKINSNEFYYDSSVLENNTEKIFWKWCKELGIIDFEFANDMTDYFGSDTKYDDNGVSGNIDHFREYLLRERSNTIYSVNAINISTPSTPPPLTSGYQFMKIELSGTTKLEPGDYISISVAGLDIHPIVDPNIIDSKLKVVSIDTTNTINDTIFVEIIDHPDVTNIVNVNTSNTNLEIHNTYDRFLQFVCEVNGVNNVKLPNRAYTETHAYISNQHGQIPYSLWNIKNTNNYKPNSQWPILPSEIQAEIQGGENVNNPILTDTNKYPGDIWGHFDDIGFLYKSKAGNILKRHGDYYGVSAVNNLAPTVATQSYPDFDGSNADGLVLNLNINDYAKAVSHVYPINSFNEFCATTFNNEAPKDFEFNAVLWYYTLEDVTGDNMNSATNLYGIEFLDTPENDIEPIKTKIPYISKYVSNGYQDGNSFSFTLDTNLQVDTNEVPSFDPEKVYSLMGMELYYEALTRLTYFNDSITDLINSNLKLKRDVDDLKGLVYNQTTIESIRNRMNNIENLLNVYSTLQIGDSDTIEAKLDLSVNPPLVRLKNIDKRYGEIYTYNTKLMYTEFINQNGYTEITNNEQVVQINNGKDFLVLVNNNDNSIPLINYDPTLFFDNLQLTFNKDLYYKQSVDILILPSVNTEPITIPDNRTNDPVNDKKLDINIKFLDDDDNVIDKKIGTFSLPVLSNYDSLNINDEPHKNLPTVPTWKINDVYISWLNPDERLISVYVEDDLIKPLTVGGNSSKPFIDELSRVYIENLLIEKEPTVPNNDYIDLSSQYEVNDQLSYIRSNIIDVVLINGGTGYPPNTTATITVPVVIGSNTYNIDIEYTTVGDVVTNVEMLTASIYTTQDIIDSSQHYIPAGNGDAEIRFIIKPITRVDFILNKKQSTEINLLIDNYDSHLGLNGSVLPNQRVHINKYLKLLPQLTLLKGYKINITRTSEQNLPISEFDKRYKIKVEKL